jgi:hypothetical protein
VALALAGSRWLAVVCGRRFAMATMVALLGACKQAASHARAQTADSSSADTAASLREPEIADPVRRTAPPLPNRSAASEPRLASLSALADSISSYLVFSPVGEEWFLAASRNRRLFVDIGRVDAEVRHDSAKAAAYREAVARRTTVPIGTRFRLRGAWGAEDGIASAVDSWNGRIVLRVSGSATVDSLARGKTPLIATAFRSDSAADPVADSCNRSAPLSSQLVARVTQLKDSLEQVLRLGPQPPYERLERRLSVASSQVVGCFGPWHVALIVSLKAGNVEWVRERVLLVDTSGKAMPVRLSDYRFRAHELLTAFDADGDGVDDLGTRATTERAGATTVLLLNLKTKRLSRLIAGFVWEDK